MDTQNVTKAKTKISLASLSSSLKTLSLTQHPAGSFCFIPRVPGQPGGSLFHFPPEFHRSSATMPSVHWPVVMVVAMFIVFASVAYVTKSKRATPPVLSLSKKTTTTTTTTTKPTKEAKAASKKDTNNKEEDKNDSPKLMKAAAPMSDSSSPPPLLPSSSDADKPPKDGKKQHPKTKIKDEKKGTKQEKKEKKERKSSGKKDKHSGGAADAAGGGEIVVPDYREHMVMNDAHTKPPHFVFVLADDLGWNSIGYQVRPPPQSVRARVTHAPPLHPGL